MTSNEPFIVCQTARPVDRLRTHPALPLVILQSGDALYAIEEQRLSELCTSGSNLGLDNASVCRTLATGVDGGARLSGDGKVLTYIRRNSIEQLELTAGKSSRRVPIPAPGGAVVD